MVSETHLSVLHILEALHDTRQAVWIEADRSKLDESLRKDLRRQFNIALSIFVVFRIRREPPGVDGLV
jgi:hypothetical protein